PRQHRAGDGDQRPGRRARGPVAADRAAATAPSPAPTPAAADTTRGGVLMTQDANRLGEHIDIDELADAAEGLVSGDRAAEIAQHLAGCPDCTANADALNEVHRLLADAPVEVMPDDVFARLQGTLAEEQRQRETAGPGYHDSPSARPAATSYRTESGR